MRMKSSSLAQETTKKLYSMIADQEEFRPGEKLPGEIELSERFGVSRSTLREAVRTLIDRGILIAQRGRGTFVAEKLPPMQEYDLSELFSVRSRLKDLYEMRLLYEPNMAALACSRGTDEDIARICAQGAREAELIKRGEDRIEADQIFHQLIAEATHNEFVISLNPLVTEAIGETVSISRHNQLISESTMRDHELIMEFLKKRDAAGARSAMNIHLHHIMDFFKLEDQLD